MQFHQLKPIKNQKRKRRVGRGGKLGTYSGRGVKGQKSRAGAKIRPAWRDLVKQIPKRRGYKFKPTSAKPLVINLDLINISFKNGEVVSIDSLLNKKIIDMIKGRIPAIKILGDGELGKKLTFKGLLISASAEKKIKKAGGNIH